jgi:copper chaperone CopZ
MIIVLQISDINLHHCREILDEIFGIENFFGMICFQKVASPLAAENSMPSRTNTELFFEFQKNDLNQVTLYHFEGITCSGCMNTVSNKFLEIDGVLNVSMNSNFSEIMIVSKTEIEIKKLQEIVSYDEKYKIVESK